MKSILAPGEQVGDGYVVEEIIGEGGMAVVARATHATHRHRVAIKILLPRAAKAGEVRTRFEREQRMLMQLHSEHTVRVYGAGVHTNAHGQLPYMILELLRGSDLEELIKKQGPLDVDRAVLYVLQACHAVAEAHAIGIIHRDIKPANLFLTRRHDGSPCIKVLDFGISKITQAAPGGEEPTLTQTRVVMGSPNYMSPELMLSARNADARSDIWALGVTIYELLSMHVPFAAETTDGVCQRILHDEPTPLRKIRPLIPGGLEAVIMRCLKRQPGERYANVADFAQRLTDFGPEHSRQALASIYEMVPPSTRGQHKLSAATARPFLTDATGNDDATVYLAKGRGGGGGGWVTVAVALATFALGAGFGWAMSLDTDPTRGGIGVPAPQPVEPVETAAPEAPESPKPPTATQSDIDLDELDTPEPAPPHPKAPTRPSPVRGPVPGPVPQRAPSPAPKPQPPKPSPQVDPDIEF